MEKLERFRDVLLPDVPMGSLGAGHVVRLDADLRLLLAGTARAKLPVLDGRGEGHLAGGHDKSAGEQELCCEPSEAHAPLRKRPPNISGCSNLITIATNTLETFLGANPAPRWLGETSVTEKYAYGENLNCYHEKQ